ncbi:MAG: orotidine-5'-phosphate decarboxylase [Candidatus Methylacidiphilales bacterium]
MNLSKRTVLRLHLHMLRDQIILALDVPTEEEAFLWMHRLQSRVGCFKIGLQLFCAYGPGLVQRATTLGIPLFLDLKLHDIPNTVASAIRSLNGLNIRFLTLHTQGGTAMIESALEASESVPGMQLLGVTVLTSLSDQDMEILGIPRTASEHALHLARSASRAGLNGLVCSPHEASAIRDTLPDIQALITPGVRPVGSESGDQSRITTPQQAIQEGASHVVLGRPVLRAENPEAVLDSLLVNV